LTRKFYEFSEETSIHIGNLVGYERGAEAVPIFIDVNTIRFLEPNEIEAFEKYALLQNYIDQKRRDIEAYNASGRDRTINANIRRLTNLGTFRAYIYSYLKNHPEIHRNMTLLVRQLDPTPQGLPIEIYCFTTTTNWNAYEDIQSDIMDHLFAIAPDFGLHAFQNPSGQDIAGTAMLLNGLTRRMEEEGCQDADALGALTLHSEPLTAPDPHRLLAALLEGIRHQGLDKRGQSRCSDHAVHGDFQRHRDEESKGRGRQIK